MTCKICYDDIENDLLMVTECNQKIKSNLCLNCIDLLIHNKIDTYIDAINNETCPKASLNMYKNGLPTHLTIDGSTFGTKVLYYVFNDIEHSGELLSKKSIDELSSIKQELANVVFAIENDI